MDNTVIFLGAGASKADGAPLQNELFSAYIEWVNYSNDRGWDVLQSFFREFFGISDIYTTNNINFPTFEEALGVLDIALNRNEEFRQTEFMHDDYQWSIIYAMAKAIQYKLDIQPKIIENRHNHNMLVENLNRHKNLDIVFVSTNYDLLLDNAIYNLLNDINYNFEYDKYKGTDKFKLCKIHGSLNWLYCTSCHEIDIGIGEKSMLKAHDTEGRGKCNKCNWLQNPIIVPPTYFKDMSNPILSQVWVATDKALQRADHIIFSGYSFPDADIHIKYLIKRAEINRISQNPLKITVMNYHKGKKQYDIDIERKRFARFFKTFSDNDYLEDKGFEDLAEYPMRYINR